ncbi:MAG: ion transporter [Bacteroidetes bacterium]|nr:MAG: ion transporter [Bacteroidota bacterium]
MSGEIPHERHELKEKIHEIIFEADTPVGKVFDVALLIIISASVVVVMLESVMPLQERFGQVFDILEWIFTIVFTIEYILRLYSVYRPFKYAISFFGIVDLLSILPTYISLILVGSEYFLIIRVLRLLRVFRIFKLGHFIKEGALLVKALRASRARITVFLTFVMLLTVLIGSIMYLIEGGVDSGFTSIPRAVYWAIVTLTTVGYGDITPVTPIGQFFSAAVMILGYAIIAVPTGIVTAEIIKEGRNMTNTQACRYCGAEGHDDDARYCKSCGAKLNER